MLHRDTIPLHESSQSDIDEIENLIRASVQSGPSTVPAARPPSPPQASIPISSSPYMLSGIPPPPKSSNQKSPFIAPPPILSPSNNAGGFGSPPNTLTEPVCDTVKRDLMRIVNNLKQVVFPNPFREDPGMALRDWDLWGPFFFIVFLGLVLSWSASVKKGFWIYGIFLFEDSEQYVRMTSLHAYSGPMGITFGTIYRCNKMTPFLFFPVLLSDVFAVAFALLAAGAVILTLNVLLLGGRIIFFQSLSLLGYCLFPLDVGALICMLNYRNAMVKIIVVTITLIWSSWAAYPFMSAAVNPSRKALALYPLFLMYVSVGFLIIAIN